MSRNAHVDLDFAGETRRFRLALGELEELQEATGGGPFWLLARLAGEQDCTLAEMREIFRIGLQGGGMAPTEAHKLAREVEHEPVLRVIATATVILTEALEQPEGESLKSRDKDTAPPVEHPNGRLEFGDYYRNAAVLKLSPSEMRGMSLWQFAAYVDGHNRANDPKAENALTDGEADALWDMVKAA